MRIGYKDFLRSLEEKNLLNIGRAADMCWMIFGKEMLIDGNVEEITLHLQTPWRIRHKQKIILSSYQIYEPNSKTKYSEKFLWDLKGGNLFDEKIEKGLTKRIKMIVEKVKITSLNDLRITFSHHYILEIFNAGSIDEIWRLFEHNRDNIKQHLVIYGNGEIEWE